MGSKRDRISEILAIKNRRQRRELRLGEKRLKRLAQALSNLGSQPELLRYFPIALVTIVEVQTRLLVQALVDVGSPYVERAAKLTAEAKFDLNLLLAISGKKFSIGELVAHTIRVSNLPDIDYVMTALMATDFLKLLPTANDWYKSKGTGVEQPPILEDAESTFAKMSALFEARHILVHELPDTLELTKDDVLLFHYHTSAFTSAFTNLVEKLLYATMPIFAVDWRDERIAHYNEMSQSLDDVLKTIRQAFVQVRGQSAAAKFDLAQDAWTKFVEADAAWYAEIGVGDPLEDSFSIQRKVDLVLSRKGDLIDPFEEIVKLLKPADE